MLLLHEQFNKTVFVSGLISIGNHFKLPQHRLVITGRYRLVLRQEHNTIRYKQRFTFFQERHFRCAVTRDRWYLVMRRLGQH